MNKLPAHKLALIEWSYLLEDFLDSISLSFEDYKNKMSGGWLFGYIEALKTAGVETVLFCFSARISRPERHLHGPTGATIILIPASLTYRRIRKKIANPYAVTVQAAIGNSQGWNRLWNTALLHTATYFATPVKLLFRHIKKEVCTAVLCQDYEHPRFDLCVLMGKRHRIPVYATFQGGNWQQSRLEKWTRPLALKGCSGLIVASALEEVRLAQQYRFPLRIAQIFNPVDISAWRGGDKNELRKKLELDSKKFIAVWHGRIDYQRKGLDILIDAWQKLCAAHSEEHFNLMLLGSGNDTSLLSEKIKISGLQNINWIAEYTNDRQLIYSRLAAADVYLFTSRNEGFAVAPLEAMACGLPLIATAAPGIEDLLKDGEKSGGIVVPQGDSNALAETLYTLFTNPERAQELGARAAANAAENFSLQAVGNQLKQFLFPKS